MGFKIKIKGLKKALRNPTHSKAFKLLGPANHYGKKAADKLGLSGKKLKRFFRDFKSGLIGGTAINSASSTGAVIPSHVGRSITDMF